jgi:hypothetical protein
VAFEVVDREQGLIEAEGESLCIGDADEERAGEAWTFGDGDGVEICKGYVSARHCLANDWDNVAKVFAGGKFGDDAAVVGVERHLRGNDVGEGFAACADDSGGGLVAGAFDSED